MKEVGNDPHTTFCFKLGSSWEEREEAQDLQILEPNIQITTPSQTRNKNWLPT